MNQPAAIPQEKLGKHPKGLYVLFFTEMWERFGYYLMVGILFLYLNDTLRGGWGYNNAEANGIVGTFIALVYLTPFLGGLLADRLLGYINSIFIGGTLMAAGYLLLAVQHNLVLMFTALFLVIIGNGFFKPNISTLLGNIYNREDLKPMKDSAFNIFYMGINIGALICNFAAAILRNKYGWGAAFGAAGGGLILGLISLAIFSKYVKYADVKKPAQPGDMSVGGILRIVFLPALIAGALGWFIPGNIFGSDANDAFMFACIPIVIFYISMIKKAGVSEDKQSIKALLVIFGMSIIFWVIYNQNSTSLTIWANSYTERSAPAALEKPADKVYLLQTITNKPIQDSQPALDEYFRPVIVDGREVNEISVDPYLKNLPKDQWPADGETLKVFNPELFQSVNPACIVIFTVPLVALFGWLRRRKKEPTTPGKIAWGLLISGLSSLVMVFAVMGTDIYHNKVSSWWLIGSYAVFTIGEICISPLGLSLVSKLAPQRFTALLMGGWFLATAIGGKLAGILAGYWDSFVDKKVFFLITFIAAVVATLVMITLLKWLNRVVKERTGSA